MNILIFKSFYCVKVIELKNIYLMSLWVWSGMDPLSFGMGQDGAGQISGSIFS